VSDWLSNLDVTELSFLAPQLFMIDDDPELAAKFLYREGIASPVNSLIDRDSLELNAKKELESRPPKKCWSYVKEEIRILICTDDEKYEKLRAQLEKAHDKGTTYIVGTITGVVGATLGIPAGVITPFCALALSSALKIGKEAYCAMPADV
jgi:hypothetical protein